MQIPSTIAGLILLGLLSYTILRMVIAIGRNFQWGLLFRRRLAKRVEALRLSKMLARLGIDREQYLHTRRINDIETHLRRCNACENKAECDDTLGNHRPVENYDFCPNEPSLRTSIPTPDGDAETQPAVRAVAGR